ncbi:N-acetylglucosaminyl-phosphatidylinositol de-N-acetylase [Dimargaris xerosporica]|nr:N-acetylglucosaminyl-phosphatidylinositol de-N-acetylase [Dimargaris xerosporica]
MILSTIWWLYSLLGALSACTYFALMYFPPKLTSSLIPVNPKATPLASDTETDTDTIASAGASTAVAGASTVATSATARKGKGQDLTPTQASASALASTPSTLRRALLVIAHPDDECMFFGPLLTSLRQWKSSDPDDPNPTVEVHVLCLSAGNYDKKGDVRKLELIRSCQTLGIDKKNIVIVDHVALPDDPNRVWDIRTVAQIVEKCVLDRGIGSIFTFDSRGVSGHMNHIATYLGVQHMLGFSKPIRALKIPAYRLLSVSITRKYISIFDSMFSLSIANQSQLATIGIASSPDYLLFISNWRHIHAARQAMFKHESQLVWFRYLYIFFSRYMAINTFERM